MSDKPNDYRPLTDYEIEQLLDRATPEMRRDVSRLVAELRDKREQESAREYFAEREVAW